MRTLTLYRDDSTTQVVFDRVKHWFWTAGNTVLTIAQYTDETAGPHRYINWPRERFCWFKDEPAPTQSTPQPEPTMKTIEYRTIDKSGWPRGEWDSEPDKKQWQDPETGLPCLIVRNNSGAWCGYVGVSPGHPLHGKSYDTIDADLDVHGGLTFAKGCSEHGQEQFERFQKRLRESHSEAQRHPQGDAAQYIAEWSKFETDFAGWHNHCQAVGICHLPAAGEPDTVWWFGFDCSHLGDRSPAYERLTGFPRWRDENEYYKSLGYVTAEVTRLAAQIAALPITQ